MDVAAITGVLTTTAATVFNGGFAANAASTISTADNTTQLTLTSTDADADVGPRLDFFRNSANPADADMIGVTRFLGENDAGETIAYAAINARIEDMTDGQEDGRLDLRAMVAGTEGTFMKYHAPDVSGTLEPEVVFNDGSLDLDFRVESDANTHALFVQGSSGNVGIGVSPTTSYGNALQIHDAGTSGANLRLTDNTSGSGTGNGFEIIQIGVNNYMLNRENGFIAAYTNNTERMRVDNSGNIFFGATSASAPSYYFAPDSGGGSFLSIKDSTNARTAFEFHNPNGTIGSITTSGSATSYNTSSDYRLKTDAQPMTGASARVLALNPVNFKWIADGTRVDGFLAHEAQAVVPEAVTGTKDGMMDEEYEVTPAVLDDDGNETKSAVMGTRSVPDYQGIDQSKIVPLLTAALQDALTEITALKTRVAALEAG